MVNVTVRYFAAAAEAAGREQEDIALPEQPTLAALRDVLLERYGDAMGAVLRSGSFLVDGVVRRRLDHPAHGTVDILPPFAGG
ncbi:MoaD/ThiS family protein [Microbacterium resistens]|uniref:MoaD/ThiS family protein n=1 Tax=Microbacterium resistens TaxID=156977 RepID=A0ABY3RUB2_9MICO|nr:MoaD/ThiS family protein [Microbacterium resistens]MBW1638943.1 MoaD/ThiS family protein [Microbacterium resistens]UGS26506.1 MoaD/ThiS family protein [Microbacterium resistens]